VDLSANPVPRRNRNVFDSLQARKELRANQLG
jgi:hypothetical protein